METQTIIYLSAGITIGITILFFNILFKILKSLNNVKLQLELLNENQKKIVIANKMEPSDIVLIEEDNDWGSKVLVPYIQD